MASAAPASWRAADPVDLSTRAGITGLGMAVPSGVQPSAAVEQRLGVEPGWIESRTGVAERHVADPADSLSDLAAAAGRSALEQAGVAACDVEMVIVATTTADQLLPNAAPLVAHAVGADRAGAIDVGAACTGFLSALSLAAGLVDSRRAATVLVVGADLMSRITDPSDRSTAGLFADGAGAAVVSAGAGGLIHPAVSGADAATGAALLCVDHDERLVRMNGLETYRHAVARLSESALQAVAAAELELEDIDLFVFHQANTRILGAVGQRLAVDPERVVDCIGAFGNTSAATVPIALCVAQDEGRLEPGARVLLGAFGAGFTWSAAVVEIGGPDV